MMEDLLLHLIMSMSAWSLNLLTYSITLEIVLIVNNI
jgi:hypothetical protein